jgi:hypothetical protein
MRIVVCSDIEAPRQIVWDYLVDPDRSPEFMAVVTRCEIAGTKRNGLGARFSMRIRIGASELGDLIEIVEFAAPATWRGSASRVSITAAAGVSGDTTKAAPTWNSGSPTMLEEGSWPTSPTASFRRS